MRSLQVQSQAFCTVALLVVAAAGMLPRPSSRVEMLVVAILIVALGVPHGALDSVFARRRLSLRSFRMWCWFGARYVGYMAAVVAVWFLAPGTFLVLFLLLSAFHFSGDPIGDCSVFVRAVQGGAVLLLPALLHGPELSTLFGMLVGGKAAGAIVPSMSVAAVPCVGIVLVAIAVASRTSKQVAFELLTVAVLVTFASPLIGFTMYFCGMHSARHIVRTVAYTGNAGLTSLGLLAIAPMLGVGALGLIGWWLFSGVQMEVKVIQLLFVGLASLTLPHMLLVEPVRLEGWPDRRASTFASM